MKPTPFKPTSDLAPTPFDQQHLMLAAQLKEAGLKWSPHVGCFVWDRDEHIAVDSPFPGRVYFILNLGHFLKRFGTVQNMVGKLVWLPTWHQARLLCDEFGIESHEIQRLWDAKASVRPGDELLSLYELLLTKL